MGRWRNLRDEEVEVCFFFLLEEEDSREAELSGDRAVKVKLCRSGGLFERNEEKNVPVKGSGLWSVAKGRSSAALED